MIICERCGNGYPDNYDYCKKCRQTTNIIIDLMVELFRIGLEIKEIRK